MPKSSTSAKPVVGPLESVARGFRKYVNFGGRATRAEYWWWWLFVFVAGLVLAVIGLILGTGLPGLLFGLAVLMPTSALTTRRLHDIGKSGLWKLAWLAAGLVSGALMFIATGEASGDGIESKILSAILSRVDWVNAETLFPSVPPVAIAAAAWVIAVAGGVWTIAWLVSQGESGPNRFGPDPRA